MCCSVLGQGQSPVVVHHTSPFLPKPNCTYTKVDRQVTHSLCLSFRTAFSPFSSSSPLTSPPVLSRRRETLIFFPHRRRSTPLFPGTCVVLVTHETRNSPMPLWLRNGLDFKTAKGAASDLLLLYHFQDLLPPLPAASAHHFDLVPRATSKPERHTDGGGGLSSSAFLLLAHPFGTKSTLFPLPPRRRSEERGQGSKLAFKLKEIV